MQTTGRLCGEIQAKALQHATSNPHALSQLRDLARFAHVISIKISSVEQASSKYSASGEILLRFSSEGSQSASGFVFDHTFPLIIGGHFEGEQVTVDSMVPVDNP